MSQRRILSRLLLFIVLTLVILLIISGSVLTMNKSRESLLRRDSAIEVRSSIRTVVTVSPNYEQRLYEELYKHTVVGEVIRLNALQ